MSNLLVPGCENITINACDCRPAPAQLIKLGLFACAPVAPTLAVDIEVLQFCRRTFVHLPPNVTGWCEATEGFLDLKGIEFTAKVSTRNVVLLAFAHLVSSAGWPPQKVFKCFAVVWGVGESRLTSRSASNR